MSRRERIGGAESVREEHLDTGEKTFRLDDQTIFGVERQVPLWLTYTTWLAISIFFVLLVMTRYTGLLAQVRELSQSSTRTVWILLLGGGAFFFFAVLLYWMWRFAKFLTGYSEWALNYRDGRLWGNLLYFSFQLFFVYILLDPLGRFEAAVLDFKKFTGFRTPFYDGVIYFPYTYEVVVGFLWLVFWAVVISALWPAVRQFLVGTWKAVRLMYANGVSIMNSLMVTLAHALSGPRATVRYPEERREPAETFRGRPRLAPLPEGGYQFDDWRSYAELLPEGAALIEWDARTGELERFMVDLSRLNPSALSQERLPDGPLHFSTEYEYASTDRAGLVVDLLDEARNRESDDANGEAG